MPKWYEDDEQKQEPRKKKWYEESVLVDYRNPTTKAAINKMDNGGWEERLLGKPTPRPNDGDWEKRLGVTKSMSNKKNFDMTLKPSSSYINNTIETQPFKKAEIKPKVELPKLRPTELRSEKPKEDLNLLGQLKSFALNQPSGNDLLDSLNNISRKGSNFFLNAKKSEGGYAPVIDSDSKVGNVASTVAGAIGSIGLPLANGQSLLKAGVNLGDDVVGRLAPKLSNPLKKRLVHGAAAGGMVDLGVGISEKDKPKDLLKRIAIGSTIGGIADIGLYSLGSALKNINGGKFIKVSSSDLVEEATMTTRQTPISKTLKPIKENKELTNVINEYNEAIGTIQNYFKTNELMANEQAMIKPVLGIDLDDIMRRWEVAQNKTINPIDDIRNISKTRRLAEVAGVEDLPRMDLKKPTRDIELPKINKKSTKIELPDINRQTVKEVAATADINKLEEVRTLQKQIVEDLEGATIDIGNYDDSLTQSIPQMKDIGGFTAYTTDVYRNFKDVFKDNFPKVKKTLLDPFDNAKKDKVLMDQKWLGKLENEMVNNLGIKKNSKLSEFVQKYGEGEVSKDELLEKFSKEEVNKIIKADGWFRNAYNELLDTVNSSRSKIYPNNPDKLIPKRDDYYRHFKDLSESFAGVKNIFDTPSQISPQLAGMSEYTRPKSKFLGLAQKRLGNETKYDAVGGFLDYLNAATYATHIDPQIPKFRQFGKDLADITEESANLNNFIGYITDFANDLAGKTNPADRFFQKVVPGGRTTVKLLNALNKRVKSNTVLGNLSSSLSQIANVPQGIAYVKNPVHLTKGFGDFMASVLGKGKGSKLYKDSGFLLERYGDDLYRKFDDRLIDQPKKLAAYLLGALDEVGTKFIWSSTYNKAIAEGIENPVKYADDVTRSLVSGRGIGEVPLLQKSKLMQLVAPFTLEVQNLWHVQKDFIKNKDIGGLMMLYLGNYILNNAMTKTRGSGVVFDPIRAIQDAIEEDDTTPLEKAGRLGGEVLSNIPLGQNIASSMFDEYEREKYFGRNDPTRYGSGLLSAEGLKDPLYKVALPFGGGQLKKTIKAGKDLKLLPELNPTKENFGEKNPFPGSFIDVPSKEKTINKKVDSRFLELPSDLQEIKSVKLNGKPLEDLKIRNNKIELPKMMPKNSNVEVDYLSSKQQKLRTAIKPTLPTIAKGLAFGRGGIPEMKEYYEQPSPLSEQQTQKFAELVKSGINSNKLWDYISNIRGTRSKKEKMDLLDITDFTKEEKNLIYRIYLD